MLRAFTSLTFILPLSVAIGQSRAAPDDSAVVALVGRAIVEHTADLITRTAFDSTRIPLEVRLPATDSRGRWQRLHDRLTLILGGREVTAGDDARQQVALTDLRVGSDTLTFIVEVTVGCRPPSSYRFGTSTRITAGRHHGRWAIVRSVRTAPYDVIACRAWWMGP